MRKKPLKVPHLATLCGISRERFKGVTRILHGYWQQSAPHAHKPLDMRSLTASGRLQTPKQLNTAQKCIKRVRPATSRMIRPLFNTELPNFTLSSMPRHSTATPDMTSFGRHFSQFENRLKMPIYFGFRSRFSGTAFCLPNQLVGCLLRISTTGFNFFLGQIFAKVFCL